MIFTTTKVATSLANYLDSVLPNTNFYEGPNQQDTETPAMFIQQRFADIKLRIAGRYLRHIGLDLVYILDLNDVNMQRDYESVAEKMDLALETFTYWDGSYDADDKPVTALIRTYNRSWRIDVNELHYKLELEVWIEPEDNGNKMRTMDYDEDVTNG